MTPGNKTNFKTRNNKPAINAPKPSKYMVIHQDDSDYKEDGKSFADLFESSQEEKSIQEGEIIEATIISQRDDMVLVDIGYKTEGFISINEFDLEEGKAAVSNGDKIECLVVRIDNRNGLVRLSKNRANAAKAWEEISEACESGAVIEGKVAGVVKGGLSIDIGTKAFLPGSQIDVRPVNDLESFVGKTLQFKVIKFNRKRGNIVLSRKEVIETERKHMRKSTLKQLQVGSVVRGKVKNITSFGAFVDLGGIDGLLHVTDMSWGRVKDPKDIVKVDEELNVRVLRFDNDKERVSLGLKQTQEDPWNTVPEKFQIGSRIEGSVVSVTDYGAFIEIEAGIEGLIHVSEMSWTERISDPRKVVDVGQKVEAVVLDIDHDSRRMSLGMKQIEPNPWDTLELKYPVASKVTGKIKNITDFGLFIGIEEGIDGLVHVSDLSWDNKVSHPSQLYEVGQEIEAIVSSIDKANERFSLSIKALSKDPWMDFIEAHPLKTVVECKVNRLVNFGVFVELAPGIEGMIHISELSEERISHPEAVVKADSVIKAEISNIDLKDRKINLSVKAMHRSEDQENLESYQSQQEQSSRSSFSDTLDPGLAAKLSALGKDKKTEDSE